MEDRFKRHVNIHFMDPKDIHEEMDKMMRNRKFVDVLNGTPFVVQYLNLIGRTTLIFTN